MESRFHLLYKGQSNHKRGIRYEQSFVSEKDSECLHSIVSLIGDAIESMVIFICKEIKWRHFFVWIFHENRALVAVGSIIVALVVVTIGFVVKMTPSMQIGNVILQIATILVSAAMYNQVIQSRRQKKVDLMDNLYKNDLQERENISSAIKKFKELAEKYDASKSFELAFNSQDFGGLRKYTYHYEYMGQMLYRRKIDFNVLFDSVSYPTVFESLWAQDSDEYTLIENIRENEVADLWNGIEFLYRMYAYKRAENHLNGTLMYDGEYSDIKSCRVAASETRKNLRKAYFHMPI